MKATCWKRFLIWSLKIDELPLSHGLSGNPSRFKAGRQELRLDEQWRRDMARWDRLSTTTIAAGSLTRYRYLPARDRSST